jgi:hypothetical protein
MSDSAFIKFNPVEYARVANALKSAASALESCAFSVPGAPSGPSGIASQLSSCRAQLRDISSHAKRLAQKSIQASTLLTNCETQLVTGVRAVIEPVSEKNKDANIASHITEIGDKMKDITELVSVLDKSDEEKLLKIFNLDVYEASTSNLTTLGIGIVANIIAAGSEHYQEYKSGSIGMDRLVVESLLQGSTKSAVETGVSLVIAPLQVFGLVGDVAKKAVITKLDAVFTDYGNDLGNAYDLAKGLTVFVARATANTVLNGISSMPG